MRTKQLNLKYLITLLSILSIYEVTGQRQKLDCSSLEKFELFYQEYESTNKDTISKVLDKYDWVSVCDNSKLVALYQRSRLLLNIDKFDQDEQKQRFHQVAEELMTNDLRQDALMMNFRTISLYITLEDRPIIDSLYSFIQTFSTEDSIDQKILCFATFNYAGYLNRHKRFEESSPLYFKSIRIANEIDNNKIKYLANLQLGYISRQIKDISKAIKYTKTGRKFIDNTVSKSSLLIGLTNIANWHIDLDEADSAKVYLDKATSIDAKSFRIDMLKGRYFTMTNEIDSAFYYVEKSMQRNADPLEVDNFLGKKAQLYEAKGNISKANEFYKKALQSIDADYPDYENYRQYVEGIIKTGKLNRTELDSMMNLLEEYNDLIIKENIDKEVSKSQIKYETLEKEKRIEILSHENEIKTIESRSNRNMLLGSTGIIGLLSLLFFQQWKQRKVIAAKNKKIKFYSREIQHRSKNQVALLSNLIYNQRSLIGILSPEELLENLNLKAKAITEVNKSLDDDEDNTTVNASSIFKRILENNVYSLSDKDITITVDEEARVDGSRMSNLALIINELSTNSIKYAFDNETSPKISLDTHTDDKSITFLYSDNGKGSDPDSIKKGTGTDLIEGIISYMGGSVEQSSTPNGYQAKIKIPANGF